jgi:glycosyltransferase involved in cell wall biosynthesis
MDIAPLERLAERCTATVRFVPRFITDREIPAYFRRADLVALPYRAIEQSGVLYTALAFGNAIVASSVGGFTEIGERDGALRLVPPDDAGALREALVELLGNEGERVALAAAAANAAATTYSWPRIAAQTLDLYRDLLR